MVYVYHRGVVCVACGVFVCTGSYPTHLKNEQREVPPEYVKCEKCKDVTFYGTVDLLYSLSAAKYVPLDSAPE
jgi:hypothetical protein